MTDPAQSEVIALRAQVEKLKRDNAQLEANVIRGRAYRLWLRDGYREIAGGKNQAAKADHYVQYSKDTLSGPTEEQFKRLDACAALELAKETK